MDPTALIVAYLAASGRLREALLAALVQLWRSLGDWHGSDTARAFAEQVAPIVAGSQQASAALTVQHLASVISATAGIPFTPPALNPALFSGDAARNADPHEVYLRPFHQLWYDLSQGKPFDEALKSAESRLKNIASTDLQLAQTHASQAFLQSPEVGEVHIVGYRRVLTGAENCGLCVVASTQRYHIEDLMPIHPACDCAVSPIMGNEDPGQIINSHLLVEGAMPTGLTSRGTSIYSGAHTLGVGDLLDSVHNAIQDTFGFSDRGARDAIDYRKVITTIEHSEIGPIIKPSTNLHR